MPETLDQLSSVKTYRATIGALDVSAARNEILTVHQDGSIRLWDAKTLAPGKGLQSKDHRASDARFCGSDRIVFGTRDGLVGLWNEAEIRTLGAVRPIRSPDDDEQMVPVVGIDCVSKSSVIAIDRSGAVAMWDANTGSALPVPQTTPRAHLTALVAADSGNTALFGLATGSVRSWRVHSGIELRAPKMSAIAARSVGWSQDGKFLALGLEDGSVTVWNFTSGRIQRTQRAHSQSITGLSFLSSEDLLVTGSHDGRVRVWNLSTGAILDEYTTELVQTVVSAKGGRIIAGALRGAALRGDAQISWPEKHADRAVTFSEAPALSAAISSNGEWIVLG